MINDQPPNLTSTVACDQYHQQCHSGRYIDLNQTQPSAKPCRRTARVRFSSSWARSQMQPRALSETRAPSETVGTDRYFPNRPRGMQDRRADSNLRRQNIKHLMPLNPGLWQIIKKQVNTQ